MKKLLLFLCAALVLVVTPVVLFAQETVNSVVTTVVETGFSNYFISLAALVPLVVLVAAFINKKLNLSGFLKQLVAWVISILLCFVGWYFSLGMFAGLVWWVVLIYGFAVGLAANGFFDIGLIQAILKGLKLEKKNE